MFEPRARRAPRARGARETPPQGGYLQQGGPSAARAAARVRLATRFLHRRAFSAPAALGWRLSAHARTNDASRAGHERSGHDGGEKKRLEEYHHKAKERGAPHEGGRKPGFGSTPAAGTHAPQTHRRADGSVDHSNVMKPHGERGPDIVEEERIFEEERRGIVPPKDVQDDAS